ncbi:MAG: UDP-N-acetylglucosamine diphosphorylase [Clostridia bacterium]|nr:UDP-N-acetylglucosamine diphosphorylase [Clostridia bacterium]
MKAKTYKNKHMSLRTLKRRGAEIYGGGAYVERGAIIERGAKIYGPCYISSGCHICGGAIIYPYCFLQDAYVGSGSVVRASTLIGTHICGGASVGPYSYLREGSVIGENCRIGGFVEVKASKIGGGSKAAHLAYIGDADIGKNVNIGCGVVFANYDGAGKRKTAVGDGCFIGCNCNIVAPVFIKDGAYIAAGTTVTRDLEKDDFCIGRCRETVKPNGAAGRYL